MKRYLLIGLISFQFFVAIGQNDLRNGYIITQENDTVRGLVQFRASKFQKCIFFNGGEIITYTPDQINGYGYEAGKAFISTVKKNVFVEVLVLGKLDLYKDGEIFHISKQDKLYTLEQTESVVQKDGKNYLKRDRKWFGILSSVTSDCQLKLPPKMKLSEKNLTEAVIEYNSCSKAEYTEIKEGLKWIAIKPGFSVGYTSSSFKFDTEVVCFDMPSNRPICFSDYNAGSYTLGPSFNFVFQRTDAYVEADLAVLFSQFSVSRLFIVETGFIRNEDRTSLDFNSISVPFTIKVFKRINKLEPYLRAGFNIDANLNPKSTFDKTVYTSISGPEVLTYEESGIDRLEVKNNSFGPMIGLGIRKRFNAFSGDLGINYSTMSSFLSAPASIGATRQIDSNTNRFSIILTISK